VVQTRRDDRPDERRNGGGERRAPRPLDAAGLEQLALRYVERFATTRAKLVTYLKRKLREREWTGEGEPDPAALAERMAELRYVDDQAFAEARAAALTRRGLGPRRVRDALRQAGIDEEEAGRLAPSGEEAAAAALSFARRRRFGPWASGGGAADRDILARQMAAMARAGHGYALSRRILEWPGGTEPEPAELLGD